VDPVVVSPESVSNAASVRLRFSGEKTSGSDPKAATTHQAETVSRYPVRRSIGIAL
jgi:hypothetical protein